MKQEIELSYVPWLAKDSALNKAMDACFEKQIGLVAMKLFAGRGALKEVAAQPAQAAGGDAATHRRGAARHRSQADLGSHRGSEPVDTS